MMERTGSFERKPHLAVAVSGGADSMALALLAHRWAKEHSGATTALTIDHGLRPESRQEADQVHSWCRQHGIEHHILSWVPPILSSAIQAHAREARYHLLTQWCKAHRVLHLLTAHHQGDQAETLFFRLARGSGMDGLACMPAVSELNGIRLIRPLLNVSKQQLKDTLTHYNQKWIEDPSNDNLDYTRNHIRHMLAATGQDAILIPQACTVARQMGAIRNTLENKLASYLTQAISLFPEGYGIIHHKAFVQMPPDLGMRTLSALATTLSGKSYTPRQEKLERFYRDMVSDLISRRRTFARLLFIRRLTRGYWLVCREPNTIEQPIALSDGDDRLWDQRFRVSWTGESLHMSVRALGSDGIKILEKQGYKHAVPLEKPALSVLPSFWHLESLAAVPHIQYNHPDYGHMAFNATFFPAKPLAGRAFFSMNM